MIKLQDTHLVVHHEGASRLLAVDELRRDLERSCAAAAVPEPELAEDVLEVVRRYCHEQQRRGPPPALLELERLIVQVLVDSGLREVAVRFQQARRLPPAEFAAELLPVAGLRVGEVLARDPFFLTRATAEVAEAVTAMLARLPFPQVSPALVQQLARHVWAHRYQPAAPEPHSYWLIPRAEVDSLLAEHGTPELLASQLAFRPVGRLFPRLAAELNLQRYAAVTVGEPLTELGLLPAFDQLCAQVVALAHRLHRRLAERLPHPPAPLAFALGCRGFTPLAVAGLQLAPRGQAQFQQELTAAFRHHCGTTFAPQLHWP
jgi:hypothetical protein